VAYNNEFGSYSSSTSGFGDSSNPTDRIQDQAAKYGQRAADAVDASRRSAASTLENAAEAVRSRADSLPGGQQVSQYAREAADRLGATADYLRDHEVKDMVTDLQKIIKNHPTPALVGAAVVGFLVGRSIRR
jgi:hypothetical protein